MSGPQNKKVSEEERLFEDQHILEKKELSTGAPGQRYSNGEAETPQWYPRLGSTTAILACFGGAANGHNKQRGMCPIPNRSATKGKMGEAKPSSQWRITRICPRYIQSGKHGWH